MKRFTDFSIKYKIICMIMISSIIPVIILGIYAYNTTYKAAQKEYLYASQINMDQIASILDLSLHQISIFSDVFTQTESVRKALSESTALSPAARGTIVSHLTEDHKYISIPIKAVCVASSGEIIYNFPCTKEKIQLASSRILSEDWFPGHAPYSRDLVFLGRQKSYIDHYESEYQYYFYRNIFDTSYRFAGILLISINDYTLERLLTSQINVDQENVILLDKDGTVISSPKREPLIGDTIRSEGDPKKLVSSPLSMFPWEVVLLNNTYAGQNAAGKIIPFTLFLLLIILLLEFLLLKLCAKTIQEPLIQLKNMVLALPENHFQLYAPIHSHDEIGELSKGVNQLTAEINLAFRQIKEEERQKEQLEFQMLQAQINPHFLYNTLNSIKLIAEFMQCSNISEAISCLMRLLQYSIDQFGNRTTVENELRYLESYIYLNNIRFKNKFLFSCQVPQELYSHKIIKFLFQPIIENSILHGSKDRIGIENIHMEMKESDGFLICTISDDGVGMSEEEIRSIWTDPENRKSGLNRLHIGLPNIDKRIKLIYGNAYGLSINSTPGKGTQITVFLPGATRTEDSKCTEF